MPRITKRTLLRAAFALAIPLALAAPAGLAQTNGAADQPLLYHADPSAFTALARPVIVPPSAATSAPSVQTLPGTTGPLFNQDLTVDPAIPGGRTPNAGALAPALIFHADPNAFTPLARPVIIPPRATSETPFGAALTTAAGTPDGELGAGVPIEPSTGVIVPAPTISRRDLLAGPSLRRGAAATRSVDRAGSTRIGTTVTTVPNAIGDVVITNREGRTRVVTR